jgi:hypothetical protein
VEYIMPYGSGTNGIAGLVVPQVMADQVRAKLGKLIKFRPLAVVDADMSNMQGNTVVLPTYAYVGDASDVAEGTTTSTATSTMTMSTQSFTVKKAVKDVLVSDEAILSTNGAVLGEIEYQLAVSIANKIDSDAYTALAGATTAIPSVNITQAGFAGLRVTFGEDLEGRQLLFCNSAEYGKILAVPEFVAVDNGSAFISGHVGQVLGIDIVVSDRVTAGTGIVVKVADNETGFSSPLGISYNRNVNLETFRDMSTRSTRIGVDCHYVTYIRNQSAVKKITSFA